MGNICFGSKEEPFKATAFQHQTSTDGADATLLETQTSSIPSLPTSKREIVVRQEQERLEWIVGATGRRMVAVRSTRGSTGYYDQGFAAALAEHLQHTTQFATIVQPWPRLSNNNNNNTPIEIVMGAPMWDGIRLGLDRSGTAGCGGKPPAHFFDHVAEVVVTSQKQPLFVGAPPVVENLL